MKNLQFNIYRGETRWVGSKKFKSIPALPHGARLKSHPILAPLPLLGRRNPRGVKWGGVGQVGRAKLTSLITSEQ